MASSQPENNIVSSPKTTENQPQPPPKKPHSPKSQDTGVSSIAREEVSDENNSDEGTTEASKNADVRASDLIGESDGNTPKSGCGAAEAVGTVAASDSSAEALNYNQNITTEASKNADVRASDLIGGSDGNTPKSRAAEPVGTVAASDPTAEALNYNQYLDSGRNFIAQLKASGFSVTMSIAEFINKYGELNADFSAEEAIAGKVVNIRSLSSKLKFYDLHGGDCKIQLIIHASNSDLNEIDFSSLHQSVRRGDIVGVIGHPGHSKRGELSIYPKSFVVLSPCFHMLPKGKANSKKWFPGGLRQLEGFKQIQSVVVKRREYSSISFISSEIEAQLTSIRSYKLPIPSPFLLYVLQLIGEVFNYHSSNLEHKRDKVQAKHDEIVALRIKNKYGIHTSNRREKWLIKQVARQSADVKQLEQIGSTIKNITFRYLAYTVKSTDLEILEVRNFGDYMVGKLMIKAFGWKGKLNLKAMFMEDEPLEEVVEQSKADGLYYRLDYDGIEEDEEDEGDERWSDAEDFVFERYSDDEVRNSDDDDGGPDEDDDKED